MELESARKIFGGQMALREEQTFCDVVVIVGDTEFPCHRVILAAASDYFKAALTTDMKEARERRILVEYVTKETFSILLTFIYSGKCDLTEENLFDVWAAADMLQIAFITDQCLIRWEKIFETKLSQHTCMEYLIKLRRFDQQVKKVLDYLSGRFTSHIIRVECGLFTMQEVKYLVAKNELQYWSENDVVEFVLTWAVRNQESICQEPFDEDSNSEWGTDKNVSGSNSQLVHNLADLLECTRYLLISPECLYGTVALHPLVRNNSRCLHLVDKISWYHTQPTLQQSCCPPAAIHRESSDMCNILLMCQLSSKGQMMMLNLKNMEWKQLHLAQVDQLTTDAQVFCYKSKIYVLSRNSIFEYSATLKYVKRVCLNIEDPGIVGVVNDSLHTYKCNNNIIVSDKTTAVLRHKLLDFPQIYFAEEYCKFKCKTLHKISTENGVGMSVRNVISIGSTEIIFCGRDDVDNYTILSTSEACCSPQVYPNQLESSSRLVTFRHDKQAFLLQENGSLWRLQLGDKLPDVQIKRESTLWDREISLNGAVLYNDELVVVGDFQNQSEVCSVLDKSLPGVFKNVRKIKNCPFNYNSCPNITLAVLPKTFLEQLQEDSQICEQT